MGEMPWEFPTYAGRVPVKLYALLIPPHVLKDHDLHLPATSCRGCAVPLGKEFPAQVSVWHGHEEGETTYQIKVANTLYCSEVITLLHVAATPHAHSSLWRPCDDLGSDIGSACAGHYGDV